MPATSASIKRADAVAIHRPAAVIGDEHAVGVLMVEHVAHAALDGVAIWPGCTRHVSGREIGHHGQRRDRGRLAKPSVPGAALLLGGL